MPNLFVLAGPNGTGKTTYYFTAVERKLIPESLPFINVDLITRDLGEYTAGNFARAELIARERISEKLENNLDFMIESNLAVQANYDWLENLIKKGYEIILYFLCTQLIDINIERVEARVIEGGHYVPPNIIEHRYKVGLSYLRGKIHIFKEVYLIDTTYQTTQLMAIIKNGLIEFKEPNSPKWVNDVLFITEKLQNRKNSTP